MLAKRIFRIRNLIALIAILVLMAVAYAFAAANTVPNGNAGDGSGTVSGYDVTNVVYTPNATNPANLDSVAFQLNAAASTVKVQLVSTGGTWYNCTLGGGTWTCNTAGQSILTIDQLRVVAVE
jgi:hypothetical protein